MNTPAEPEWWVNTKPKTQIFIKNSIGNPWNWAIAVIWGKSEVANSKWIIDLHRYIWNTVSICIQNKGPLHNQKITPGLNLVI